MPQNDLAYLQTRRRQSEELAADSDDVSVQIAHKKMADQYAAEIALLTQKRSG